MKRFKLLATGVALSFSFATYAAVELQTAQDKLSYSIGYMEGTDMHAHSVSVSPNAFTAGLTDGLANSKGQLTQEEMKKILNDFQNQQMENMKSQIKQQSINNLKRGNDFLSANKAKAGIMTTPDGLQYKVLTSGNGTSPTLDDEVTVNYEGRLLDGTIFDSSYQRGKPATFPLKQVIKGWQEALTLMKPGATWEVYIPAGLAYGEQGAPGIIGPNEVLIFKINLTEVKKG